MDAPLMLTKLIATVLAAETRAPPIIRPGVCDGFDTSTEVEPLNKALTVKVCSDELDAATAVVDVIVAVVTTNGALALVRSTVIAYVSFVLVTAELTFIIVTAAFPADEMRYPATPNPA